MTIRRISAGAPSADGFGPPVRVQGGEWRMRGDDRLGKSGGRFKLDCRGRAALFLLSGEGFLKWARGEIPFAPGDAFALDGEGEVDLYGECVFLLARE